MRVNILVDSAVAKGAVCKGSSSSRSLCQPLDGSAAIQATYGLYPGVHLLLPALTLQTRLPSSLGSPALTSWKEPRTRLNDQKELSAGGSAAGHTPDFGNMYQSSSDVNGSPPSAKTLSIHPQACFGGPHWRPAHDHGGVAKLRFSGQTLFASASKQQKLATGSEKQPPW